MKNRKLWPWLTCMLALIFVGFVSEEESQANTFTLKASTMLPAQHPNTKMLEEWGKEVEKRTKGVVRVNVFPGGTLTPPQQIFDGVVSGISEVGQSVFAYNPARFPVMEGMDAPTGYQTSAGGTKALMEFHKLFKPKELSQVHVCYLFAGGPSMIHSKTPIRNLEDMKGKKIRATGTSQRFVKALGAVPVAIPAPDVYDALGKGLVEGNLIAVEAMYNFKQYEVIKYTTRNKKTYWQSSFYVAMNLNTWNSFPEDIKKTLTDLNEEWALRTGKAWDADDQSTISKLEKLGHQFIDLPDAEQARWVNAAQIFYQEYIEYAKSKGLDGEGIVKEAKRLIEKYGNE